MMLEHYQLKTGDNSLAYKFISEGPKGNILKLIQFSPINDLGFYNLAFGDKNSDTGEIDDLIITDNGDGEKVLATVVIAIYAFCDLIPNAWIYATGSTIARTRLYRRGIHKYFDTATVDFKILGQTKNGWEPFIRGQDYQAFLIQRKVLHLKYEKFN